MSAVDTASLLNSFSNDKYGQFAPFAWMDDIYKKNLSQNPKDPVSTMIAATQNYIENTLSLQSQIPGTKIPETSPTTSTNTAMDCGGLLMVKSLGVRVTCNCSNITNDSASCSFDATGIANYSLVAPYLPANVQSMMYFTASIPQSCACK